MKYTSLIGLLLGSANLISATPLYAAEVPEGYAIAPLQVTSYINGVQVVKEGTIQEVIAQLQADDPNFQLGVTHMSETPELGDRSKGPLYCCPIPGNSWTTATLVRIYEGIDYLDSISASCSAPAYTCVRVSCSWSSGIWMCNDNSYTYTTSCSDIGGMANDILNACSNASNGDNGSCGQEFDSSGYNVFISASDC